MEVVAQMFCTKGRRDARLHRERYSIHSWVDKYRTGSGSDRVIEST